MYLDKFEINLKPFVSSIPRSEPLENLFKGFHFLTKMIRETLKINSKSLFKKNKNKNPGSIRSIYTSIMLTKKQKNNTNLLVVVLL